MAYLGQRIRYWRRVRGGMTQEVLAGLTGCSQSYISKVEQGVKTVDRRATLVAIANALDITVAQLLDQPGDPADPRRSQAVAAVPAIRVAVAELLHGERRPARRTAEETRAAASHVMALRQACDFGGFAPLLPDLLHDLAWAGPADLAEGAYLTSSLLRAIGYRDLAWHAAELCVRAAENSGDPAWVGVARHTLAHAMPIEARASATLAENAANALQAHTADPMARRAYGMLHLSAAFLSTVTHRPTDTAAHLAEAEREARTLGEPTGPGTHFSFGPTNIVLWRMAVALESGEPDRALELADQVHPGALPHKDRACTYHLDRGRALAATGRRDRQALAAFLDAERAAPQFFRLSTVARDEVSAMVHRARRRTVDSDLRRVASRLGVYDLAE
ncbi:helix-turn-helix transcriptional regulator [Longispora sp. NPDC051575]|uniref:helix-turn-helix domain-containing protein n=1 Tax=Longispora sp. NPDC051575 TaxID=3154943 RepID=UPI0034361D6F